MTTNVSAVIQYIKIPLHQSMGADFLFIFDGQPKEAYAMYCDWRVSTAYLQLFSPCREINGGYVGGGTGISNEAKWVCSDDIFVLAHMLELNLERCRRHS